MMAGGREGEDADRSLMLPQGQRERSLGFQALGELFTTCSCKQPSAVRGESRSDYRVAAVVVCSLERNGTCQP
jgi:hypothetical protein